MALTINLPMNLRDLALWENGELKGFALPLKHLFDLSYYLELKPGTEANILEPFRRLNIFEEVESDGKPAKKVIAGVIYRSDGKTVWNTSDPIPEEYEEAARWSPAHQLPEFAVRRKAIITKIENATLLSFTKEHINLLKLDYESQNDPQIILEEYIPHKEAELVYKWWKDHYRSTLRSGNNPDVVILHLAPSA